VSKHGISTFAYSKKNNYKNFKKHITDFKQAKDLILDIRGYPAAYSILAILSHFIDFIAWVGQMKVPIYYMSYIIPPLLFRSPSY
jgi:hypothetical protein